MKNNTGENIYSLKGGMKVFVFTLQQTFKNKGYITSLIIFVIMFALMGPIQCLSQNAGANAAKATMEIHPDEFVTESLTVLKKTTVTMEESDFEELVSMNDGAGIRKENIRVLSGMEATAEDLTKELEDTSILLIVTLSNEGYVLDSVVSDTTQIRIKELSDIAKYCEDVFDNKRMESADLSDADLQKIFRGVDFDDVMTQKDYFEEATKELDTMDFLESSLAFAIIVLIASSLSTSYIITSVTEEKQSKLAESLMVSVRPMALLVGKIMAMLCYILAVMLLSLLSSGISNYVMRNVLGFDYVVSSGMDFTFILSWDPKALFILMFSIVLNFMFFSFLSGIFGSACSKQEDLQIATSSVMSISLIAYLGAMFISMADITTVNAIASIIPPFSFIIAPVAYLADRISLAVFSVSLLIQIAMVIIIVMLSAKIYRKLLLNDSIKPRFKEILQMIKR